MELLHQSGEIIAEKYRILDILGQGASGTTYLAQDLKSGKRVALKALSLRRMNDWKMIELFEREARILAQLNHPAIPRYIEYFYVDTSVDRSFYITQQLAEGKSLAALVQSGWRTSEKEVRRIAIQILEILVYLHELKPPVIHRDIKPQNIIRREDGQVFLVDFGAVQDTYYNTFMRGSTVVGTYGYMAPEQFRGQAVPATDLYGLGATLLFLLTHRSPADLPTDRLKINFRYRVQISEAFADWLEKMLEPDVEDRFASAKEALEVLQGKRMVAANSRSSVPWKGLIGVGIAAAVAVSILNHYKYPILSSLGFTPRAMYEGIMNGNVDTVRYYLDRGVNVNARDFRDSTPLHWSVSNNKKDIVEMLINKRADLQTKYGDDAHTVLHISVQQKTKDVAELLIDKGAYVNAKDKYGKTPLHAAILKQDVGTYYGMSLVDRQPSKEMIEMLISKRADVNAKDDIGHTPLYYANRQGYQHIVEILRMNGAIE